MHIYRIDIDNFKSFAERTLIPFETGFTTISGPNGSGKSNIIDSMLFCLGLSSSRTMRAEKLSDLINNLSKRKECKVTITFRKELAELGVQPEKQMELVASAPTSAETLPASAEILTEDAPQNPDDPDNHELAPLPPIDLSTGEFLQVARRIKGGSQGYTSTYYLNDRPTTLSEIHEVLGNYNISPGTYNVMMQGDVASIVNMSATERRKIIDEIAGVGEFDRKIEQAHKELEATGTNIERNTLLLTEIEARLEQLSGEREHALKYKKIRDERHVFEGMLLSAKYLDLKKAIQRASENIAQARKQKETVQDTLQGLAKEIIVTRQNLQDLSSEVKKKGEDQQIALKKQIEGLKGHIARKEDAVKFIDEKTQENHTRVAQMTADITRQKENIEALDAEIAGFVHQLKELQALFNQESKAYEKLNARFDALTGTGGELGVKRAEIRKRLAVAEDERSSYQRGLLDAEAGIKRVAAEKEMRLSRQSESSQKQSALTERHQVLSAQVKELDLEKSAFEAQISQTQLTYSKTRVALNETIGRYNQVNKELMQLDARKRAYEEVGFHRSVESVLNAGIKGVHGTLAQLGTVDPEFALSMEIAMGGRVQNLVVDNESVASQGIEHLQRTGQGRATFLPINKIQPFKSLPALPAAPGVVDFAFNLLSCNAKYDDIFAYALGDTLIVEDMEAARPLLRKYRMVTLDGSLLEKSGAMTGGSAPGHKNGHGGSVNNKGKGGGYFASSQSMDTEIEALQTKFDEVASEKERLEKQLTQTELKLEGVKTDYAELMNRHARAVAEFESLDVQLKELRQMQGDAFNTELTKDLDVQHHAFQKEQVALEKKLAEAQKSVDVLAAELEGVEKQLPSEQIDGLRKEMADVKFQMDYYDGQIRNAQADIKSKEMEKNYQEVGIQDHIARIEETDNNTASMAKEKIEAFEEIELTQRQINELEAQTSELDEELKKLQQERDAVQNQLLELEKNKNIQEREAEQLEEQILSFKTRKRELEPQLEETATELRTAEIDPETIVEEGMPSAEEITTSIQKLTRKMEAMEPVNMLAIEEYDRVQERRDELSEKIQTLSAEKEAILFKITGYEELKRASFMKAFESVDNNFKSIFAELSDGNGHLMLTSPDDPFAGGMAIYAQPRGKKIQRIEAMSGGEKSLTSLAFVFALQRYMPAPFYALDEVDMNLDGINAEKLANMVKREAGGAQFVVVSLRKPMIEHSDRTIGVTQKKNGITKVTGIKLRDEDELTQGMHDLTDAISDSAAAAGDVLTKSKSKDRNAPAKKDAAAS